MSHPRPVSAGGRGGGSCPAACLFVSSVTLRSCCRQRPTARAREPKVPCGGRISFYFGSSPDSIRFRHVRARPQVSATHLPSEDLAVTVHGRAVPIDVVGERNAGFRQALLEIYVSRYGPQWEEFLDSGPVYARIDADRMFTFSMPPGS